MRSTLSSFGEALPVVIRNPVPVSSSKHPVAASPSWMEPCPYDPTDKCSTKNESATGHAKRKLGQLIPKSLLVSRKGQKGLGLAKSVPAELEKEISFRNG